MSVRIQEADFDPGEMLTGFAAGRDDIGAIVSFSGIVRNDGGSLREMVIEHYPGMTEKAIAAILDEATKRWDLGDAMVIHRYGKLRPGATIMMVATAASHRADAFAAAEFLMDFLKSRAPFWKKEIGSDGSEWVEAQNADEDALSRW